MSSTAASTTGYSQPPPRLRQRMPVYVLWITALVSIMGNMLTALAVPWFVLETTGSASRTGITAAVTVIPIVIASFFGGALVDRMSYKGLSVVSDVLSGITVAAVPLLYLTTGLSFPALLVLMFLGAILDVPGSTAREAMIPPLSRLTGFSMERINANFGMIRAASGLFAAPLAGLAIAWLGPLNVLWFNAGTFAFSALMVLCFIPRFERAEPTGSSFMSDVREGFAFVRSHALIRTLIVGALGLNFMFAPLFGVAVPWFANQELQSVRSLGILMGTEGLGALTGAFIYGRFAQVLPRRTFLTSSLILLVTPILPLAFSTELIPAAICLALVGMGSGMVNPMIMTFIQQITPSAFLGRIMGLFMAGAMMAQPVGLLLGGLLISRFGFQGSVIAFAGVGWIVGSLLMFSPVLKQIDAIPETQPSDSATDGEAAGSTLLELSTSEGTSSAR